MPVYPIDVHRVAELLDGRIFGTVGAYEGNFIYDPTTGKSVHLGKIPLSYYSTAIRSSANRNRSRESCSSSTPNKERSSERSNL